ncbi:MAG: HNH endonuclease [Bdellovibrionales bacterium]|nr:HNH endonuclease [Bdellovibrionales bacterium]
MNLKHLTDKSLLIDTKKLARTEREISLKILHHLREIERRRLFSDLGYGSLFDYAVKELGYSEPSASRRIHAARLLTTFPELEKKISDGDLTMTNVALAAQTFKNENILDDNFKKEILAQIENTSKRSCEKMLLGFSAPTPLPKEKVKVLSPTFYSVHLNLAEPTMKLFNEVKDLLAHKRMNQDEVIRFSMEAAAEKIKNVKFKVNAKFTTPGAKPCTKRYIPSIIKKEVYLRDKGKCTKCRGTYKLEYDHVIPYARGGKSNADNLRLLCFSCNQRRLKN